MMSLGLTTTKHYMFFCDNLSNTLKQLAVAILCGANVLDIGFSQNNYADCFIYFYSL